MRRSGSLGGGAMIPVIIESPYAASERYSVVENMAYLDRCILDCLERGETPYASHKMLTTSHDDPVGRTLGINAGLAMRRHLPLRAFYTDHGWSGGMQGASDLYWREKLIYEVRHLDPDPPCARCTRSKADHYYKVSPEDLRCNDLAYKYQPTFTFRGRSW